MWYQAVGCAHLHREHSHRVFLMRRCAARLLRLLACPWSAYHELSPQTTMCDSLVSLRATGFLSSLPNDSTVPNNTPLVLERRPTRTSCCGGNLAARPAAHRGAAEGHVHQRAYLCLWAKNRSSALLNVQQDAHTHTLGTREIDRRRTALAQQARPVVPISPCLCWRSSEIIFSSPA